MTRTSAVAPTGRGATRRAPRRADHARRVGPARSDAPRPVSRRSVPGRCWSCWCAPPRSTALPTRRPSPTPICDRGRRVHRGRRRQGGARHGHRRRTSSRCATRPLEAAIASLSTVTDASVSVALPDTLVVRPRGARARAGLAGRERALSGGRGRRVVRRSARSRPRRRPACPSSTTAAAASAGLAVGQRLDAVDLDAATRLASLVPADIGSARATAWPSRSRTRTASWSGTRRGRLGAMFGFYTPSLRTPELVPGQVRLLRSLLIGREPLVERVILASGTDGTYIPQADPDRPSRAPSRVRPAGPVTCRAPVAARPRGRVALPKPPE